MTYYFRQGSNYTVDSPAYPFDDIVAVAQSAGYTIVDTVTANNYEWAVLKNPSSNNGVIDYHIGVGRTNSAFYSMILFEEWNTSSKTANKIAPYSRDPVVSDWTAQMSMTYLPGSSTNQFYEFNYIPKSGQSWWVWGKKKTLIFTMAASGSISTNHADVKAFAVTAGLFDSSLASSADPAPLVIYKTFSLGDGYTPYQNDLVNGVGRFTRTAGINRASGFAAAVTPLNYFSVTTNAYGNNFIVSKAMVINTRSLEINLTTGQNSARFIGGFRGTLPDIFYAANSLNIDKQVSWSMSNSLHYGRNIQLNGYFRTQSGIAVPTILCTMAVVLE